MKNKAKRQRNTLGSMSPKVKTMKKEYIVKSVVPIEITEDGEIYHKSFKRLPEAREFARSLFREGYLQTLTNVNGVRLTI